MGQRTGRRIELRLSPAERAQIEALAARFGINMSAVVRLAVIRLAQTDVLDRERKAD